MQHLTSLALRAGLLVLALSLPSFANAEDSPPTAGVTTVPVAEKKPHRPKICLVLSGGGARGYAHIGVLKVLEAQRIPIDCIAATSMGSVIGGLYASGMRAEEIERKIKSLNLADIAVDRIARRDLPQAERNDDFEYTVGGTLGYGKNGLSVPIGAVQANLFTEVLQNWTAQLPPNIAFDRLTIPFRAIATDLQNGDMVVFDKGPLHLAIRASMAAPGVYSPVDLNGRLLADGGMVRNLPVDIARQMGANIVIAVNIGTPLMSRDKLTSFVNISQQMLNILTEQNVNTQKKTLTSHDILIEPDLGNLSFGDFERMDEAIQIGQKTALAAQQQLAHLALNKTAYAEAQNKQLRAGLPEIQIKFIDVKTSGFAPAERVKRQLDLPINTLYDAEMVNRKLDTLLNTREFESVNHQLVQRDGEYGLEINARERSWGPHFFRFGLNLSSNFDGDSNYKIKIGHRRPWLNQYGLEWRNDIEFGTNLSLFSELRQPLSQSTNPSHAPYLAPYLDMQRRFVNVYAGDTRLTQYRLQSQRVGLDLGVPLSNWGEVRLGVDASHVRANPTVGAVLSTDANNQVTVTNFPTAEFRQYGVRARFTVDQLNEPSFPRHGYYMKLDASASLQPGEKHYNQAEWETLVAGSYGNHSLNLGLRAAGLFQNGSDAFSLGYSLGGFQRLSAYPVDRFSGNYMAYGQITYLLRALNFNLLGQSVFLGASAEAGNVWNQRSEMRVNDLRKSASLFLGVNSVFGPLHLGIAVAPGGQRNIFFQLGR